MCFLVGTLPNGNYFRHELAQRRSTIGRLPLNQISLEEESISAIHAELIRLGGGRYLLRDLRSTNGTRVDGEAVSEMEVTAPCRVAFGRLHCEIEACAIATCLEHEHDDPILRSFILGHEQPAPSREMAASNFNRATTPSLSDLVPLMEPTVAAGLASSSRALSVGDGDAESLLVATAPEELVASAFAIPSTIFLNEFSVEDPSARSLREILTNKADHTQRTDLTAPSPHLPTPVPAKPFRVDAIPAKERVSKGADTALGAPTRSKTQQETLIHTAPVILPEDKLAGPRPKPPVALEKSVSTLLGAASSAAAKLETPCKPPTEQVQAVAPDNRPGPVVSARYRTAKGKKPRYIPSRRLREFLVLQRRPLRRLMSKLPARSLGSRSVPKLGKRPTSRTIALATASLVICAVGLMYLGASISQKKKDTASRTPVLSPGMAPEVPLAGESNTAAPIAEGPLVPSPIPAATPAAFGPAVLQAAPIAASEPPHPAPLTVAPVAAPSSPVADAVQLADSSTPAVRQPQVASTGPVSPSTVDSALTQAPSESVDAVAEAELIAVTTAASRMGDVSSAPKASHSDAAPGGQPSPSSPSVSPAPAPEPAESSPRHSASDSSTSQDALTDAEEDSTPPASNNDLKQTPTAPAPSVEIAGVTPPATKSLLPGASQPQPAAVVIPASSAEPAASTAIAEIDTVPTDPATVESSESLVPSLFAENTTLASIGSGNTTTGAASPLEPLAPPAAIGAGSERTPSQPIVEARLIPPSSKFELPSAEASATTPSTSATAGAPSTPVSAPQTPAALDWNFAVEALISPHRWDVSTVALLAANDWNLSGRQVLDSGLILNDFSLQVAPWYFALNRPKNSGSDLASLSIRRDPARPQSTTPTVPEPAPKAMAPQPVSVMILGDSLALCGFGSRLDKRFREAPNIKATNTYMACGTVPLSWLKEMPSAKTYCGFWSIESNGDKKPQVFQDTYGMGRGSKPKAHPVPKLEDLFAHAKPEVLIIQTGTNLFSLFRDGKTVQPDRQGPALKSQIQPFIAKVVKSAPSLRAIYWVASPKSGRIADEVHDFVIQQVREQVGQTATVIDSRKLVTYPYRHMEPDHEHFIGADMDQWADKVFDIVEHDLTTRPLPLALAKPPEPAAKTAQAKALPANPNQTAVQGVIKITARLAAKSKPLAIEMFRPYQESLVTYLYDVQKVTEGEYPEKQILVVHPAHLGLKPQPLEKLKVGKLYNLTLRELDGSSWNTTKGSDDIGLNELLPYIQVTDEARFPAHQQ